MYYVFVITFLTIKKPIFIKFRSIMLQRFTFEDNEMRSKDLLDVYIFPCPQ